MESKQLSPLRVLMLPWLAHGHISPYLNLAKKLTTNNFYIYICSTPANLESIKHKLTLDYSNSIQLVELHLPCLPDLPPHFHTTNGLPPHLMLTLKQAFDMSSEPEFSKILETLNPNLLIYDYLQPWAPILANKHNIPAVEFITFTPSMMSFYHHFCGDFPDSDTDFPFPEIYMTDHERMDLIRIKEGDNGCLFECMTRSNKMVLFKTFREIEGKYLDYLEASSGKKIVPVGPLVDDDLRDQYQRRSQTLSSVGAEVFETATFKEDFTTSYRPQRSSAPGQYPSDEFTRWLDGKEPLSTVFVSFGSEYYCSREELEEIGLGLEMSGVNFIWVIRFPSGENTEVDRAVPGGFLERVRGRGVVVERWAPQMRILRHSSVGGFVSHCGVSSMMESLMVGVPVIGMPMHLDQPVNARLLGSLGVAMEVGRDGDGRYCREEIGRVVREVMVGEKGKVLRRRAKEMSCLVVERGDEEIEDVVKELVQLCEDAKKI